MWKIFIGCVKNTVYRVSVSQKISVSVYGIRRILRIRIPKNQCIRDSMHVTPVPHLDFSRIFQIVYDWYHSGASKRTDFYIDLVLLSLKENIFCIHYKIAGLSKKALGRPRNFRDLPYPFRWTSLYLTILSDSILMKYWLLRIHHKI